MEIEKVTIPSQIYILAELAYEIWPECYAEIISAEQINYMIEKFQSEKAIEQQIKNEGYEYYFVTENNKILGFAGIKPEYGKLLLSKLYIRKPERNKGCASFVFDFLENMCRESGMKYIYLTVNKNNTDAIDVYKKRGFYVECDKCADIGGGFVMDDHVMRKDIV